MEIIKKNLLSVIFGAVALVAVIAVLLPLGSAFGGLEAKLKQRKSEFDQLNTLMRQRRDKPIVDPERPQVQPLKAFPNQAVIDWGRTVTGAVRDQAKELTAAAMAINDRLAVETGATSKYYPANKPLTGRLVPMALPTADKRVQANYERDRYRSEFLIRYDNQMRNFYSGPMLPGMAAQGPGELVKRLNATVPPSDAEIKAMQEEIARTAAPPDVRRVGGVEMPGAADARTAHAAQIKAAQDAVPGYLRAERARKALLYIDPRTGLFYNAKLLEAKLQKRLPDNEYDIWWAQLGFWIQEDVVQAIADTHKAAGSTNVTDSVVKNLIEIGLQEAYLKESGPVKVAAGPSGGGPQGPGGRGASPDPNAGFRFSPTGRIGNELYDVVWFRLRVDTDARRFSLFLNELVRDRLISIREISMAAIDRQDAFNQGFYYGDDPVVRLVIKCEAVLLREWTRPIMPEQVKNILDIREEPRGRW